MANPNRALKILTSLMYSIRTRPPPYQKKKKKNFASIINDLLLLPRTEDRGLGGMFREVSMEGKLGMVKGAGIRVGCLGKSWLVFVCPLLQKG